MLRVRPFSILVRPTLASLRLFVIKSRPRLPQLPIQRQVLSPAAFEQPALFVLQE